MAETRTLARPYAEAVFELARAHNAYGRWSQLLALLSTLVRDPRIVAKIDDPQVDRKRLANQLLAVLGDEADTEGRNFLHLLVDNRRLRLLPEIAELYEQMRADAEGRVDVTVRSAFPLEGGQRDLLLAALKRRFGRDVNLSVAVDPSLLGGVEIRAGDQVIDGSVRGRLAALSVQLTE